MKPEPWLTAAALALPLSALAVAAALPQPGPDKWLLQDGYVRSRWALCELPVRTQALLGLALALAISLPAVLLYLKRTSRRAWLAAAGCAAAWAVAYRWLPFHLSSPDYDDFFVVDKFLCSVGPDWPSNKPFFTAFDFLFRIDDFLGIGSGRFARFGVNGWLFVVYELDLLLILQQHLGERVRKQWGVRGQTVGTLLALGSLPPLVLSHTHAYELACAVAILTSFNVVESCRLGEGSTSWKAWGLLSLAAVGIALQLVGFPQFCALWFVVCVHIGLTVAQHRSGRPALALAAGLAALSAGLFILQDCGEISAKLSHGASPGNAVAAVLALAGAACAAWLANRRGLVARWRAEASAERFSLLVLATYGLATFGWSLVPEGLRPTLFAVHWPFATVHARYSLLFYPFFVLGLGRLACWLPAARGARRTAVAVVACAWILWNARYVTGFYLSPIPAFRGSDAGAAFQRNLRPLVALDRALPPANQEALLYLPIPRDHGDHYLVRAVRPNGRVASLCAPARPSTGRLVLSRNTLNVCESEPFFAGMCQGTALGVPVRGLSDKGWEVQTFDASQLDRRGVDRWCAALGRAWKAQMPNEARRD